MATNSKSAAAAVTEETLEDGPKVPHQDVKEAKVTSIKRNDEPEFYGEDGDTDETLAAKAKRLVKNKRVIGGAAAAALLTISVLVVRKRNSVDEQDNETPTEA